MRLPEFFRDQLPPSILVMVDDHQFDPRGEYTEGYSHVIQYVFPVVKQDGTPSEITLWTAHYDDTVSRGPGVPAVGDPVVLYGVLVDVAAVVSEWEVSDEDGRSIRWTTVTVTGDPLEEAVKREALMTVATPPGGIRTTKASVYARRAAQGIDLDKRIIAHIENWRDTVPAGTVVTLDKMINCTPDCGCPPDRILTKCKGNRGHGLAIEIVMDHLFPPDGTDCSIPGVIGRTMHGPLQNPHLVAAYARFIHKL